MQNSISSAFEVAIELVIGSWPLPYSSSYATSHRGENLLWSMVCSAYTTMRWWYFLCLRHRHVHDVLLRWERYVEKRESRQKGGVDNLVECRNQAADPSTDASSIHPTHLDHQSHHSQPLHRSHRHRPISSILSP